MEEKEARKHLAKSCKKKKNRNLKSKGRNQRKKSWNLFQTLNLTSFFFYRKKRSKKIWEYEEEKCVFHFCIFNGSSKLWQKKKRGTYNSPFGYGVLIFSIHKRMIIYFRKKETKFDIFSMIFRFKTNFRL